MKLQLILVASAALALAACNRPAEQAAVQAAPASVVHPTPAPRTADEAWTMHTGVDASGHHYLPTPAEAPQARADYDAFIAANDRAAHRVMTAAPYGFSRHACVYITGSDGQSFGYYDRRLTVNDGYDHTGNAMAIIAVEGNLVHVATYNGRQPYSAQGRTEPPEINLWFPRERVSVENNGPPFDGWRCNPNRRARI